MKKTFGITVLIVLFTMCGLIAGSYFATQKYIDPVIEDLRGGLTTLPADSRAHISLAVNQLEKIRQQANLIVPAGFLTVAIFLIALIPTFLRGQLRRDHGAEIQDKQKPDVSILTDDEIREQKETATVVGVCQILATLQNKGRLIDFLQENIHGYPDAQIGAAVRHIHEDCKKALDEYVTLVPVMEDGEGAEVTISDQVDPSEIRLTGHITDGPPFRGTVHHSGWKATRIELPRMPRGQNHMVIAPAEVEVDVEQSEQ